jgi:NhaA family Na+:H+ antiporter
MAVVTWFFFLESGVHATLAGVAIGLLTPAAPLIGSAQFDQLARRIIDTYPVDDGTEYSREKVDEEALALARVATESVSPLNRLEESLHLWSSFAIVPIFALANAGIRFEGVSLGEALDHPVALGVAFGLVFGKTIGISLATWIAVRTGIGKLPSHTEWSHVVGVAMLAGIGFTVALFVAGLAFPTHPEFADRAKVGIFVGSAIAGVMGYLVLRRVKPSRVPDDDIPTETKAARV